MVQADTNTVWVSVGCYHFDFRAGLPPSANRVSTLSGAHSQEPGHTGRVRPQEVPGGLINIGKDLTMSCLSVRCLRPRLQQGHGQDHWASQPQAQVTWHLGASRSGKPVMLQGSQNALLLMDVPRKSFSS